MYEDFFGLSRNPFQLSPDPFFMIPSERSKEAVEWISNAVRLRKGLAVLTGEVGTGKTLVLRCLVEMWEGEETPYAYFIGPRLSTVDFLSYITFELGITVAEPSKGNLLRAMYGFLLAQFEKGLTTVLIIDEAHQMPRSVLEEIRLLMNFETAQQKLVQIVLVGQPELDKKLDSVELRSLKQRIAVRCRLEPLGREEIGRYIERRLELAGADAQSAASIFPAETVKAIYRTSQGIPRLVNSICDQALMAACGRKMRVVPAEVIKEVATNFRLEPAAGLKQGEKPALPVIHVENPVAYKPRASAAGPDAPTAMRTSETLPGHRNDGKAVPVRTESRPDARQESVMREAPGLHEAKTEQKAPNASEGRPSAANQHATFGPDFLFLSQSSTPMTPLRSGQGQTDKSPNAGRRQNVPADQNSRENAASLISRWLLKSGLRITLFVGIAVVVPAALATGVFMARRQKGPVPVPNEVVSARETVPIPQTASLTQRAAASVTSPVVVGSLGPIVSPANGGISKSAGGPGRAPRPANPIAGALPKPVFKSYASSNPTEAPAISAVQTKSPDVGKGLIDIPSLNPAPPVLDKGGEFQPPKLLSSTPPAYPSISLIGDRGGVVVISAVVDETGKVTDMKVVSGNPVLQQAAMQSLRTWKYEAARLNGRPTASHIQVKINFTAR